MILQEAHLAEEDIVLVTIEHELLALVYLANLFILFESF